MRGVFFVIFRKMVWLNVGNQFLRLPVNIGPERFRLALFLAASFQNSPIGQSRYMPLIAVAGMLIGVEALVVALKEFLARVICRAIL